MYLDELPNFEQLFISLVVLAVLLVIVSAILYLGGYLLIHLLKWRNREEQALSFVLLEVAVPRENEIKIDAMEQLFSSLYSIKKGGPWWKFPFLSPQDHFSFEIVGRHEDIRFFVSVPSQHRDLMEKQIHGTYGGAVVREVEDYNLFDEEGEVAYLSLKLRSANYFPIKSFKDMAVDPMSVITSALAKLGVGETCAIQVIVAPADNKWRSFGKKYVSRTKKNEADPEKAKFNVDAKSLELIESKTNKPGFMTTIRIVASAKTKSSAKQILGNVKAGFEQFNGELNGFSKDKIWIQNNFMTDFIYRYQPAIKTPPILSSEELATIFHFPNKSIETPHIFWLNAKRAPAPSKIADKGLYLGKSVYRGVDRPIFIDENDRRQHVYIVGATGTGKSLLMSQMILQDIRAGKGVCFIDPHDTYQTILEQMPPERAEDVIYFDPSNLQRPMGLNIMEAYSEAERHYIVSSIIGLFYKLYDPHQTGIVGPRLEHNIRNAMLTVMAQPGTTFIEVQRALTDPTYVQELLPLVTDPMIRRYWTDQIAQTAEFHKSEILDYIVSKFGRFTTNKLMRNMIGQSKSAFDFRKVMDEGKILIINLAKGLIGEENSNFLGLLIIPKILTAAMSRSDIPMEQRKDFYLYVDEFQNFATPDFATILSEARKYRLNLTVANQFISQMEEEVRNAVFGNVGTMVAFRTGVNDAQFLAHQYAPTFNEQDLLKVEAFNAYVRTVVGNEPQPAFSMEINHDFDAINKARNPKVSEMIRELAALKYGRDVK
ncbi:MAG: DUF87 domain-containing protein, partial [bacterium]|nr:DUF87 domain-containing protein [bacterium]